MNWTQAIVVKVFPRSAPVPGRDNINAARCLANSDDAGCSVAAASGDGRTPERRRVSAGGTRGSTFVAVVATLLLTLNAFAQMNAFQAGATAYEDGDYSAAAEAFRKAAQVEPASGTLQNLGLCEWQIGRRGYAIQAWEQSLWVNPFNAAAEENLKFARKATQLAAPELAWYEVASTWLPVNAWAILAGASLWFAVGMVLFPRIFRWRRAGWQQALAATGFAVFLVCLPSLVGIETRAGIGIVLEKDTPLRLTPTAEAQTLSLLTAGEPARCERKRGKYLFIRTSFGKGWIERDQFGRICPE